MARQKAVLISGSPLANRAALAMVVAESRAYFAEYGDQQPPLPDNVLNFAPCGVLITEWEGDNRERIGRIEISKPDGRIVYDKAWLLDGSGEIDLSTLVDRGDGTAPMLFGDQANTPLPPRAPPRGPRVFNESISEGLKATDSVDATVDRSSMGGLKIQFEGVSASGIAGAASITEEDDRLSALATVLADIWKTEGQDVLLQIDRAEQELVVVREFLLALRTERLPDPRRHNNPPELLDGPDVDIEALDAAIQSLKVLRPLLTQPQPDFEVVKLIWSALVTALRLFGRLMVWAGLITKSGLTAILNSKFGQAVQTSAGTVVGTAAATALVAKIAGLGPQDLVKVIDYLKAVAASAGHPF